MKTIMIVPELPCKNCHKYEPNACVECFNINGEKEQVPETWEELKELCIKLKRDYDITCVSSTIWVNGLSFNETGIIGDSHHSFIVEDRTPAQMWNIIKSLIGAK